MFRSIKEKLLGKQTEERKKCEFDFSETIRHVTNKRFERNAKAQNSIAQKYDLDTLSDEEYTKLWHEEADKILEEEKAEEIRKKSLLRKIKTLRTQEEIDAAIEIGQKVLKEKVIPSDAIRVTDLHIKDKQTGEIIVKPYSYHALPRDYDRYEVVEKRTYYPYTFPSKEAAYLLPEDIEVGERVILEDLIEDIIGESHAWGTYRLDSAEALWNGQKFEVDCKSYDVSITMG